MTLRDLEADSPKRGAAERRLPNDLMTDFDALVVDYEAACLRHVGRAFVNYEILADLLAAGWRKSNLTHD